MTRVSRRLFLLAGLLMVAQASGSENKSEILSGHFTDEHLAGIKSMTLPRTFLYDQDNRLVPQEEWPPELNSLKENVGAAYCCVSDAPRSQEDEGPPKDCERLIYGKDIGENFGSLEDGSGNPIRLATMPRRKWLLVEYFATWCSPCLAERKSLATFFKTPASNDYVWLSIDISRLPEAQEAAKTSN